MHSSFDVSALAGTPAPADASATTGTSVTTGTPAAAATYLTSSTSVTTKMNPKMCSALKLLNRLYWTAIAGVDNLSQKVERRPKIAAFAAFIVGAIAGSVRERMGGGSKNNVLAKKM